MPKDNNLWIFGAWFGEKYNGNSKFLFEYVNENHPEIRAVWITKNEKTLKLIKEKGFEVYKMNSLNAHVLSLRASVCIVSHSVFSDLNLFITRKTKIVQLWHGTPLKRIHYDAGFGVKSLSLKDKLLMTFFPHLNEELKEDFSVLTAPSLEAKEKFSSAFHLEENRIKITGYPRNDGLFDGIKSKYGNFSGIYLPTFRDNSEFDIFGYDFDLSKIENTLTRLDIDLYIQVHPYDDINNKTLEKIQLDSDHIHCVTFDDLYSNLKYFDFLITDYSSVYFDYLLLERPIIFAPFDYENYTKGDRELYYDYPKVTPGPKAKNWNDLIFFIEEAKVNPDKYSKDILNIKNMFNEYSDGNNSQRVFNEIKKVIGG